MGHSILLLTDYKGFFGSKQKSSIYRGGMDVDRLITLFTQNGYSVTKRKFSEINIDDLKLKKPFILYTSSEDNQGLYKSFIEDIVFNLESLGLHVIPSFSMLKAHNNKVAMEILRDRSDSDFFGTIKSHFFGTLQELISESGKLSYPVVIKPASGAMSRGVAKADNPNELIRYAKKVSRSFNLKHDLKDLLRKVKYGSRYHKESFFRSKFIVQNFIPGLENDWKVLVYGNKCFVLYRGNRERDFRASGSGKFVFMKDLPDGLLDFAFEIKNHFKVPNISLDIGFDGNNFHLIEFQFLYFGTTTIEKSPFWFEKFDDSWKLNEGESNLEGVYVESIVEFLNKTVR